MPIYDITVTISPFTTRWPGDPPVIIDAEKTIARDGFAVSSICMGSHTGTHVDAPRHLLEEGDSIERIPLDTFIGKAFVFEVKPQGGLAIQATDLVALGIPRDASRVLLKTSNSELWQPGPQTFEEHYVHLSKRAAQWLAGRDIKLVGVDYLSVDSFPGNGSPAHLELLGHGVVILEGLNLAQVPVGVYQLVALPLKLAVTDGAPVRAVLIR
jgi:arylformamidase